MKKTILTLIVILFALSLLTACGNDTGNGTGNGNSDTGSDSAPPGIQDPITPQKPAVFSFIMGDVLIELDEDISYVIAGLGEPVGILEQPSCAFDGIDRIFRYPGIQIYTYPKNGADHIHTIGFFDDSIVTTEGKIHLGSNIQDVFKAYGENYRYETGMYTFTRGKTVLEFLVSDDNIIGITYRYLLDL